jgi:penicillin-binding protein 1A
MGVRSRLPDVPSLPIGADEVRVLEHTGAFATFPNLGQAVQPHAILEVRTPNGGLVWSFEHDGKKPEQVISKDVALEMIRMMGKVVQQGTGRRAALDGIPAAGKTGTTNGYRDAWFVGFTGNYVAGVWFGNDDHRPTDRMTGGSVPALTWHEIMTNAHRGVAPKELPGMPPARTGPAMASSDERDGNAGPTPYSVLSPRVAHMLRELANWMEHASRPVLERDAQRSNGPALGGSGRLTMDDYKPR